MSREIKFFVEELPINSIIMWHGATASVPDGWALCNGENGTPDLRDRFIVGAGGKYMPSNTGGSDFVSLSVEQMPSHNHGGRHEIFSTEKYGDHLARAGSTWKGGDDGRDVACFRGSDPAFINIQSEGNGQPHENRPPYYALLFIMKVKEIH
ncbi:hypothetical protein [Burkholderia humptydooensis]|uniref:hypothetical protein n=1 Tax=Burkholderia humptydooensis TaxID=430531 RepID=UPI00094F9750|nr:hypothetical protein [Burkholderia humptydooensis]